MFNNRVIKSLSVVDDRLSPAKTAADALEEEMKDMSVIKRQLFTYQEHPYLDQELIYPDRQGYLDELNRLKLEIADAKDELRRLGGQIFEQELLNDEESEKITEMPMNADGVYMTAIRAQEEAERLLAETRENIQAMMAAYTEQGEAMCDAAKNAGYLEGFDKGFAEAQQDFVTQYQGQMETIAAVLENISNYSEEQIATNESDLVSLVIQVSNKILRREIKEDKRSIVQMLYKELDDNRREENVRITISPDLMPVEAKVAQEVRNLITAIAPNALVYINNEYDDCTIMVETDKGITDMSVDVQLNNLEKIILDK